MNLLLILTLAIQVGTSAGFLLQSSDPVWFVFLTKGEGRRPENQDELMKMQKAHIDNFKRRFAEGKLLAAGPLNDPTGFLRGIVVLRVPDRAAVLACFQGDPYVENKIMDVDAFRWEIDPGRLNVDLPDPGSIEENRLLLIRRKSASELDPARLDEHRAYATKAYTAVVQGEARDGAFRQVFLFKGTEETRIRASMVDDPLARAEAVEFLLLPLWLAKDVLPDRVPLP